MNLETKITIYKFTPQVFTLTQIKLFRANLRGVADKRFFLFRIAKLYAYPH